MRYVTATQEAKAPLFSKNALVKLIVPLVIEQFLAVAIGMADTIMVTTNGEWAVSSISLVDSINILFINLFAAMATGGAVVVSQYLGMREEDDACAAAKQLWLISFLISSLIMAVCLIFRSSLITLIFGQIEEQVSIGCNKYFLLSALSYPFLAIYNSGAAIFRSMEKSRVSMYISFIMNIVNIVGNAVLIFVFDLDVVGAGASSLASRALGAIIISIMLLNKKHKVHIKEPLKIRFDGALIKKIIKIAVPTGLENSMFQFGKLFMARLISTFRTYQIAANAVSNTVVSFSCVPGNAIGLATITVVGHCIGAGEKEQAYSYSNRLLRLTYIITSGVNIIVIAGAKYITSFFNLSPEAEALATSVIIIYEIVATLIWPLAFTMPYSMRASGDVKFTMAVSIISMWIFRVAFGYLICHLFDLGVHGVWIAMYVDWVCRLIFYVKRYLGKKWLDVKAV